MRDCPACGEEDVYLCPTCGECGECCECTDAALFDADELGLDPEDDDRRAYG